MNKRQAKKNRTAYKKRIAKIKAVVNVDLKNVTPDRQIDIYVSNRFEATEKEIENGAWLNESQNKGFSDKKKKLKGYTHLAHISNGTWYKDKGYYVTLWLSDTDKSYYVIRPKREPEEGETVINP